jgi:hypothetical protein
LDEIGDALIDSVGDELFPLVDAHLLKGPILFAKAYNPSKFMIPIETIREYCIFREGIKESDA